MSNLVEQIKEVMGHQDLRTVQANREADMIREGVELALERITDVATGGGASVFKKALPGLIVAAENMQIGIGLARNETGARLNAYHLPVLNIEADQIAALFYQQVLNIASGDDGANNLLFKIKANTFYTRLGRAIEQQMRYDLLEELATGCGKPAMLTFKRIMKATGSNAQTLRRAMGRFEVSLDDWMSSDDLLRLGMFVSEALLPVVSETISLQKHLSGKNMVKHLVISPQAREEIEQDYMETVAGRLSLGFMVCEPRPIVAGELDVKWRYMTQVSRPSEDELVPSEAALKSLNATQSVPYAINREVVAIISQLTATQVDSLVGITSLTAHPDAMRSAYRDTVSAIHVALDYSQIWFPGFFDFRGRQYQATYRGLSPQGSELSRGVLTMANGAPLGQKGLWYLYHELGNVWGFDKELLDAKVAKAKALPIAAIAADPLANLEWLEADEPTKALACILDIAAAEASGNPEGYVSHLIVNFDGSCNGMQHLALLTRDPVGASATNVIGSVDARNDFYNVVAERVLTALEDNHSEEAEYLKAIANKGEAMPNGAKAPGMRSVVKRGVMTIPYGATDSGLIQQFVEDFQSEGMERPAATLMRDLLLAAMDGAAPKAMEVRTWLGSVARSLGKAGVGTEWITPNGTAVSPRYNTVGYRKVRLLGAEATNVPDPSKVVGVKTTKHVNGVVANVIHSLDANALQDTVVGLLYAGVETFSFIHDSFGCLAGDAETLNRVLRVATAGMYSRDVLGDLMTQFEALATPVEVELTAPPELGNLCPNDVMTSPYFFA